MRKSSFGARGRPTLCRPISTLLCAALATSCGFTEPEPAPAVAWENLAANSAQACGITIAGDAYCWGRNDFAQLGNGSKVDTPRPSALWGERTYSRLTTGSRHSCGLTTEQTAYCWGMNDAGQLGDGTTTDRILPVAVAGGHHFTMLVAGGYSACGVTTGGETYCWGFNDSGQLGDGSTTTRTTPVLVVGGLTFTDLAAGDFHTCGRTAAGVGYCWGRNDLGQLGDGSTTQRESPAPVVGGLSFVAAPRAGFVHTCGLAVGGTAYCWGYNYWGQLGDGYASEIAGRSTPGAVAGSVAFAQIAVGALHTCGVTAPGNVWCWGYNGLGQLGNNSTQLNYATPVPVTSVLTFESLVAGEAFTCGLASDGSGYCWGRNLEGQLGDGTRNNRRTPVAIVNP